MTFTPPRRIRKLIFEKSINKQTDDDVAFMDSSERLNEVTKSYDEDIIGALAYTSLIANLF